LASSIAAAAPALSGTLAVRPGTASVAPVRRPFKRHPTIPVLARDLGNGMSAFVPPQLHAVVVIVFDNVTGVVTGVCNLTNETSNETVTSDDVASCANTTVGQLLSGFVRFQQRADGADLDASDVEDPPGPILNMRIDVSLSSSGHPQSPTCYDDANSISEGQQPFASYFCVIHSNVAATWSGSTIVEPRSDWVISDNDSGTGFDANSRYRVCRYTVAASDSQPVPNQDHPRNYVDVSGNLTDQNFVVIRSVKHCPTDVPANPAADDLVNSNTLQHQPAPS
jgi:hypothetical protein